VNAIRRCRGDCGETAVLKYAALATSQAFGAAATVLDACCETLQLSLFAVRCQAFNSQRNFVCEARGLAIRSKIFPRSPRRPQFPPYFLEIIVRRHANRVEASIEGLDNRFRRIRAPTRWRRDALCESTSHRDFIIYAIRLQSVECSRLHQTDHVRSGIYGGRRSDAPSACAKIDVSSASRALRWKWFDMLDGQ